MSIETLAGAGPSGIDVAFERFGDRQAPPVLLVMGLATQMLGWHEEFCSALVARGLQVIRFDNRDVGLSTHLNDAAPADVMAALSGDTSSAAYRLSDMAADTVGLLDGLGLDSAHIVGASMGGMIAQTIAIEHPDRVRSLTSIMSTTGDPSVGQSTQEALGTLLAPPASSRQEAIERAVAIFRVIGSPGFELDEEDLRARVGMSYDRADDPPGVARQIVAILASADRTARLRSIQVPALVLHGAADPLVDVSGARATAEAIPGAELVVIDGMGHGTRPAASLVARDHGADRGPGDPRRSACHFGARLASQALEMREGGPTARPTTRGCFVANQSLAVFESARSGRRQRARQVLATASVKADLHRWRRGVPKCPGCSPARLAIASGLRAGRGKMSGGRRLGRW
jgi:pimeloyl-ACP methyl ester carboxylesterase